MTIWSRDQRRHQTTVTLPFQLWGEQPEQWDASQKFGTTEWPRAIQIIALQLASVHILWHIHKKSQVLQVLRDFRGFHRFSSYDQRSSKIIQEQGSLRDDPNKCQLLRRLEAPWQHRLPGHKVSTPAACKARLQEVTWQLSCASKALLQTLGILTETPLTRWIPTASNSNQQQLPEVSQMKHDGERHHFAGIAAVAERNRFNIIWHGVVGPLYYRWQLSC